LTQIPESISFGELSENLLKLSENIFKHLFANF